MAVSSVAAKAETETAVKSEPPNPSTSSNPQAENGTGRNSKLTVFIALGLAIAWWIALANMAAFTSNPPTLNYKQFSAENAEVVVVGIVKDRDKGTFNVTESHFAKVAHDELTITNLDQSSVKNDGEFIIPLRRTESGAWEVVPTPLPKNNLIVYPVTDHTRKQFEAIKSWRAKSALPLP